MYMYMVCEAGQAESGQLPFLFDDGVAYEDEDHKHIATEC